MQLLQAGTVISPASSSCFPRLYIIKIPTQVSAAYWTRGMPGCAHKSAQVSASEIWPQPTTALQHKDIQWEHEEEVLTREDEGCNGPVGVLEAHTRSSDSPGDGHNSLLLADDTLVQCLLHLDQALALIAGHLQTTSGSAQSMHLPSLICRLTYQRHSSFLSLVHAIIQACQATSQS